jgi:Viral BACON domain
MIRSAKELTVNCAKLLTIDRYQFYNYQATTMNIVRLFGIFLAIILLSACSGGGGEVGANDSKGSSSSSSSSGSINHEVVASQSSLKFSLNHSGASRQTLTDDITSSDIAFIEVTYAKGVSPVSWLNYDITGAISETGAHYTLGVNVDSSELGTGDYATRLVVTTSAEDGEILFTKIVMVTLTVTDNLTFLQPSSEVVVPKGSLATEPVTKQLFLASPETVWTASTNQSWLRIRNSNGKGAAELEIIVDATSLAAGDYSANLTIKDANNPNNSATQRITVHVVEPLIFSEASGTAQYINGIETGNETRSVSFTADSKTTWSAYSDQDWLSVETTNGSGSGRLTLKIIPNALSLGVNKGTITIFDTLNNSNSSQFTFNAVLMPEIAFDTSVINNSHTYQNNKFIYGSDLIYAPSLLPFTAGNSTEWLAQSDKMWLNVGVAMGVGSGSLSYTLDASNLAIGAHHAVLELKDTSHPKNMKTLHFAVQVAPPILTTYQDSILLGGPDGLADAQADFKFSINTGKNAYPYKLTILTDQQQEWLSADATQGVVSSAESVIRLRANTEAIRSGSYNAKLILSVQIKDMTINKEIPVVFNKEANRLVVSRTGVAFHASPSRSMLTRTLKVLSSIDRNDVEWKATSDQPWLTVTQSGMAGDDLFLQADDRELAADATYFATVTVRSDDKSVENYETIRVGFTVSSQDAEDISINFIKNESIPTSGPSIVASSVEPLVFISVNNQISAYDTITGALIRSFGTIVPRVGAMALSQDGLKLFVYDMNNLTIVEIDATSGEILYRYPAEHSASNGVFVPMPGYLRPNGKPILIGAGDYIYDLENREQIGSSYFPKPYGYSLTTNENPSWVVTTEGTLHEFFYSALEKPEGKLRNEIVASTTTAQGREGQACINATGNRIYTASGSPYNFFGTGIESLTLEQTLPGTAYPNSIICSWTGMIIGGASSFYNSPDVYVYDGSTGSSLLNVSSSTKTSYRELVDRGLAISGDSQRLISLSYNEGSMNFFQLRIINLPSAE